MSFFNTCIMEQATQIWGIFNKNLILVVKNFLYGF